MKRWDKPTRILSKLAEIAHWIAAVSMLVVLLLSFLYGADIVQGMEPEAFGASLSTYGLEITVVNAAGQVELTALRLFCIGGGIILALMALVFRSIYFVLKLAEESTPFQADSVRQLRRAGLLLLLVPLLGLTVSVWARLFMGPELVEASVGMDSFMVGLAVLCLSQFFAHGAELEAETEGLL